MTPPTVERLAPAFLERPWRASTQAPASSPPCSGPPTMPSRRGVRRPQPSDLSARARRHGRSSRLLRRWRRNRSRGRRPRRHGSAPAHLRLAIFRHEPGDAFFFGTSHKIAHQATYRQTIRDCSWGSSVEETSRLAVIQRAQNERRCGPDAFQGFPHLRSRWELDGGDAAIHR